MTINTKKALSPLLLLLLLHISCLGQSKLTSIYKTINEDGSISIFGENHGFLPYSVVLEASLSNVACSKALPARLTLYPAQMPQLLALLVPQSPVYHYRYKYHYDLGDYTMSARDSSYIYATPFGGKADSVIRKREGKQYAYLIKTAANTPICAARNGVVAEIKQRYRRSTAKQSNIITIYHADGTYACYVALRKNSASVQVGQQVKIGDQLALVADNEQGAYFWFLTGYPGQSGPVSFPARIQGYTP